MYTTKASTHLVTIRFTAEWAALVWSNSSATLPITALSAMLSCLRLESASSSSFCMTTSAQVVECEDGNLFNRHNQKKTMIQALTGTRF